MSELLYEPPIKSLWYFVTKITCFQAEEAQSEAEKTQQTLRKREESLKSLNDKFRQKSEEVDVLAERYETECSKV